jgi:NTE family protein
VGDTLDAIDPTDHLNIRAGSRRDARRLARLLAGEQRALVLGAGGARAFAQVGAIRALEEHGHEFDVVVGSGFGAVVGAQYAAGWSPDELLERNRRAWMIRGRVPTVPSISLFGGRGPARTLRGWFGASGIEDSWLSFRPCTAELSTATAVTPRRGQLAEWVRAASAAPGLYPPHVLDGRLHVDGSVIEPLPVFAALGAGASHLTAIDTIPMRTQLVDESVDRAPEGLSWFPQILPVAGAGFPGLLALVERSIGASQRERQRRARERCDLVIEPPVDRYRSMDFQSVDALAELGYLETACVLDRLP